MTIKDKVVTLQKKHGKQTEFNFPLQAGLNHEAHLNSSDGLYTKEQRRKLNNSPIPLQGDGYPRINPPKSAGVGAERGYCEPEQSYQYEVRTDYLTSKYKEQSLYGVDKQTGEIPSICINTLDILMPDDTNVPPKLSIELPAHESGTCVAGQVTANQ